jgi:hypothetical protein
MQNGKRLPEGKASMDDARNLAKKELDLLPAQIRSIKTVQPYEVRVSDELLRRKEDAIRRIT